VQILGPTKIIADERSNSLLVFATRQDMKTITNIVAKLDVLLPQVLIESVIMDVSLSHGWNFGVSATQNPRSFSSNPQVSGGGGYNNGQTFFDFANSALGTNASSVFGNQLSSGLSYFGDIGQRWDVALEAAANDNNVTIIQRPSVQTSQARAASFFVGQSVPYQENAYYGGSYYGGGTSYAYMQVGIGLAVTPFINPNGLVVMDIQQQISDLVSSTGPGGVLAPTTDTRTLQSEVAVKSGDTIMLGGYISTDHKRGKNGVPILQDIPLLGNLFSSRSDSKDRSELIVLLHPTVLTSPDVAAAEVDKEIQTLPGISRAMIENKMDEQKQMEKVRTELQQEGGAAQYPPAAQTVPGATGNGNATGLPPASHPPAGAVNAVRQYESGPNLPPAR
ncbi:MAG: hypothetical protein KGR98_15370, partial [Verrucomicrobia bacterium]|nr:hypothetical protein [Verrucomicrobiota bacterium]